MLIRFNITNFLSFDKETEFNMLAGNVRRHPEHVSQFQNIKLLKSSIIYGANGSGKSNIFHALSLFQDIVVMGELDGFSDSNKFKLNPKNKTLPITFEIEFITKKKSYAYGISFNQNSIIEEWLYQLDLKNKSEILLFERKTKANGKSKLTFSDKYLKSEKNKVLKEVYEDDLLEKDVPFIFLARNQKFKEISEAYNWFEDGMLFIFPGSKFKSLAGVMDSSIEFQNFSNSVIKDLDTGIKELKIKTMDFDTYFGEDNPGEKERVLKLVNEGEDVNLGNHNSNAVAYLEDGKPIVKKLYSIHESTASGPVEFELYEESEGSLRLFDFLPAIYLAINQPITILIDEIDQSIHVNLLKELISKIQAKGQLTGQMVFTTHESNLLDLDLFRQDEIWFSEKDKNGATSLYPLSDFDIRTEMDVAKGYLSGRFGGIPFLGNLKELNWLEDGKKTK